MKQGVGWREAGREEERGKMARVMGEGSSDGETLGGME